MVNDRVERERDRERDFVRLDGHGWTMRNDCNAHKPFELWSLNLYYTLFGVLQVIIPCLKLLVFENIILGRFTIHGQVLF